MKLDLIAIRKLSPSGLWDLAELVGLIVAVQKVICLGMGSLIEVQRHSRMVAQYRKQLSERKIDNFNKQVKAWVLQCPERIAFVRGVINEAAIKRWKENRLLDYAFTKVFGDWKTAFPNGVRREDKAPRRGAKRVYNGKTRFYNWKPFALVKIVNAKRILFGQGRLKPRTEPVADAEQEQIRAAYLKLWGVDIADIADREKASQPRTKRSIKPILFTPYELEAGAATGTPETLESTTGETGKAKIYPPQIVGLITAMCPLKTKENTTLNIEEPKPP